MLVTFVATTQDMQPNYIIFSSLKCELMGENNKFLHGNRYLNDFPRYFKDLSVISFLKQVERYLLLE